MRKVLAIVLGILLVTLVCGTAYAVKDETTATAKATALHSKGAYGQCVSQNALAKNSCFSASKSTLKSCVASAKANKDRAAFKQCKSAYKASKKQCKMTFKTARKQCMTLKNSTTETSQ